MKRAICLLAVLMLAFSLMAGCAANNTPPSTISDTNDGVTVTTNVPTLSVTGVGEKDVEPDMATVNLGINIKKPTAEEATNAASAIIEAVKAKLLELGVKEEDMQTTNFYISPEYRYDEKGQASEVESYYASNMLEVKVRDLTKVGKVIDEAVKAGANSSYGVSFGLADPTAYESETLKLAVENAKKRAEAMANAIGKQLDEILVMTDGTTSIPEIYKAGERAMAAQDSVSISPGTLRVSSSITLRFTLK